MYVLEAIWHLFPMQRFKFRRLKAKTSRSALMQHKKIQLQFTKDKYQTIEASFENGDKEVQGVLIEKSFISDAS